PVQGQGMRPQPGLHRRPLRQQNYHGLKGSDSPAFNRYTRPHTHIPTSGLFMLNADALNQLRQLKTDIEENKVVYPGTVKATTGRFGFVILDEGRDVFLPPEEMQKVLPGDRVNITEQDAGKGKTQGLVDEL